MAYVTLAFAMIGAISIALAALFFAHRLTKQWDEMASGCLVIPLQMVSFLLVGFAYIPFSNCTIDTTPSHARKIINNLRDVNDSLKNEIAVYKGRESDLKGWSLEDDVFYITSNTKYYHLTSDCYGLSTYPGEVKHEKLKDAIENGRILCRICDGSSHNISTHVDDDTVYICTGSTSKKYHCDRDCQGLSHCTGEIEEISEEDAEDMGRTPCKICY